MTEYTKVKPTGRKIPPLVGQARLKQYVAAAP